MTRVHRLGVAVAALPLLLLGACSGDNAGDTAGDTAGEEPATTSEGNEQPDASEPADGASGGGEFCGELEANGATGASFGAVQITLPKDELLASVREMLDAMGEATPPQEIADAWETQRSYLQDLEAAAAKLPAGGTVSDPALFPSDEVTAAYESLTDYWFANCAA